MRKPTLKRLALGLVQQTAALLLMVAIAAILFNSYLAVDTADGAKVYELSPLDAETEFEDSVIFHDLFQSSVSDIIQLMVIKGQMETNGSFDPYKYIDITEFVSAESFRDTECPWQTPRFPPCYGSFSAKCRNNHTLQAASISAVPSSR